MGAPKGACGGSGHFCPASVWGFTRRRRWTEPAQKSPFTPATICRHLCCPPLRSDLDSPPGNAGVSPACWGRVWSDKAVMLPGAWASCPRKSLDARGTRQSHKAAPITPPLRGSRRSRADRRRLMRWGGASPQAPAMEGPGGAALTTHYSPLSPAVRYRTALYRQRTLKAPPKNLNFN